MQACANLSFEKKRPVIEHVQKLDSPEFRTTVIGPVMLMDGFINLAKIFLPAVLGVWKAGHKRKLVDSYDIGRVAAICLTDPGKYSGLNVNLAGDELTPEEIAAAFKDVKGITLPTGEKPPMPPFLETNFKVG